MNGMIIKIWVVYVNIWLILNKIHELNIHQKKD